MTSHTPIWVQLSREEAEALIRRGDADGWKLEAAEGKIHAALNADPVDPSEVQELAQRLRDCALMCPDIPSVVRYCNEAADLLTAPPTGLSKESRALSGGEPSGADLIAAERARQVSEEGWTPEHDDQYGSAPAPDKDGEFVYSALVRAAICYAAPFNGLREVPSGWPWDESWWKCDPAPIRNLTKAGALLAAEIDRLQRAALSTEQSEGEQAAQEAHERGDHSASESFKRCPDPGCQIEAAECAALTDDDDDWITCPRCDAEGREKLEWVEDGKYAADSGEVCRLCKGDMGFGDADELLRAIAALFTEQSEGER